LYLAHDTRNGVPAFLARPVLDELKLLSTTPLEVLNQFPSASVAISWNSSESPPYRVLKVRAPRSVSQAKLNEELTAVADDMPRMMDRVLERPDVREHLLSARITRARRLRGRLRGHAAQVRNAAVRRWKDVALVAAACAFVGSFIAQHGQAPTQTEPVSLAVPAPLQQSDDNSLTSGLAELSPGVPLDEMEATFAKASLSKQPLARPVPRTPLPGQARSPCPGESAEVVNGGCWVRVARKPPCPNELAEYNGGCYIAVKDEKAEPLSSAR
jgi:hypothetical protein